MTTASLRPMRWWDVEDVMVAEHEVFRATAWSAETFWAELAQAGTRHYVVARDSGGTLLGYAGLLVPGPEADVQTIAITAVARGQGLGGVLMAELVDRARSSGCSSVLLEVRADNEPAQRLYARFGFERIAVRRGYYQPGGVDAWVMRLRPVPPSS